MIKHRFTPIRQLAVLFDILLLCGAYFLTVFGRREILYLFLSSNDSAVSWSQKLLGFFYQGYSFSTLQEDFPLELDPALLALMVGVWFLSLKAGGAYNQFVMHSLRAQNLAIIKGTFYGTLGLMAFGFIFIYRVAFFPRTMVVLYPICAFALLVGGRVALYWWAQWRHKHEANLKSIVIVGTGELPKSFVQDIKQHPEWGLRILGFVGLEKEEYFDPSLYLGHVDQLDAILHSHPIDSVVFAVPISHLEAVSPAIELCELEGVETHIVSDLFRRIIAKLHVDDMHGLPVLTLSTTTNKEWQMLIKRIVDIVVSGLSLLFLFPFLVCIAVLVKFSSSGPIFYRWHVVGYNKKDFIGYKFRTMFTDADQIKERLAHMNEMQGPVFKITNDPRVTKVGRFLRKFSLDELPQLYSVLKGDMSLVGPRPGGIKEVPGYDNWHRRKLSVKPGITCLWQIRGRNEISSFDDWVKMDLEYIDNWSFWLDMKILLKTVPVVFTARGAS